MELSETATDPGNDVPEFYKRLPVSVCLDGLVRQLIVVQKDLNSC